MSSAKSRLSDGPQSIAVATPNRWARTWAAATAGLPGPTTLVTRGMVSVPKVSAAMAAGPFARKTRVSPSSRATASVAASAVSVPGIGGTTTAISGTPATTAGVPTWHRTDGNEPLPAGTYSPADGIGVNCSPSSKPGRTSARQG